MTDDIDTLSGPELSAAVAREVMGFRYSGFSRRGAVFLDDAGKEYETHEAADRFYRFVPHVDRNDAHAVLVRFGEIGGDWSELMWLIQGSEQGQRHFGMRLGLIVDPTIICRAALRAVRGSK